jgi:hypothetical protein
MLDIAKLLSQRFMSLYSCQQCEFAYFMANTVTRKILNLFWSLLSEIFMFIMLLVKFHFTKELWTNTFTGFWIKGWWKILTEEYCHENKVLCLDTTANP